MKKWVGAFQVAAVYVGTVIGAGFATGKEIVEFFTKYGFVGFLAILLAGYLFILLGSKVMVKAIDLKANSYEELNEYLFGSILAKIMNIFMMIMLIGVCAVMLSGAGAVFQQELGIAKWIGVYFTIGLTILVMAVGSKGIFAVNTFVVPIMILFNFLLMTTSVTHWQFFDRLIEIPSNLNIWKVVVSPFSYAAFNLALAQAVLVPIAGEVKDKKVVKLGGIIGGILLTLILISSHFTLITLPNVQFYEIPMAAIVKNSFIGIYFIYVLIIFGEIFTSLIGNIYGLEKQFSKYFSIHRVWIFTIILIIIYCLSYFHYGTLLSYLYPLFGYFSLLFIFLLWIKPYKKAIK
ncbi:hypothetical protein [Bacillus sp. FJAT-49736]|uniref:YkvI family membrane protein n=1 Tax=Bacillus sp. FJAT-49736 TaxID=2833582 RepID=UPI001BC97D0B|nr:hypothetical protein [Bacillus sp. FJAT-49736]